MTNWQGKNVTVFGLGMSGLAIAKKLSSLGSHVFVTDSNAEDKLDQTILKELKLMNVDVELGGHSAKSIEKAELIVLSPGVPSTIKILNDARQKNIPVISEIELAYRFFTKPIIAITGTNGKTTTTALIGELFKAAGRRVAVAGNIGVPLISIDDSELDFIVAEISSYQLETVVSFRPWISILLNLTEDHLTRHGNMEEYGRIKSKIFSNQRKTDYLVYNADDPLVTDIAIKSEARLVPFSKRHAQEFFVMPISEIKIKGEHNLENAMAAVAAAKIAGVINDVISLVLRTFPGVEHRIEFVRDVDGVQYYNDSKATNADSTIVALKALGSMSKNIILILGGRDKGGDLTAMAQKINETVKKVILIGEATERFEQALLKSGFKNIEKATTLNQAVIRSQNSSSAHDIVLLSPACASFDMFKNFEDRGEQFKTLVKQL